jgi:hypothetical protein
MSALSVDSLLATMEAHFDTLTLGHLCKIAHRAHLTQYELTSVDGEIYRQTVLNILKRRYIFGVIAALFKPLNSNVFECIAKFVDFDIVWQKRVREYVSSCYLRYKNSHARAIIEWRRSNALFLAHHVLDVHNTGRKKCIMLWIAESPEHQLAYYQFKKEKNIAYQTELASIKKRLKDVKQEVEHTRDLMKYAESTANFERLESELREMHGKQEPIWLLKYGWINFPESTELLYTNPKCLEQ